MVNMLMHDDAATHRPVLSWYKQTTSRDLVRHMKTRVTAPQDLSDLVEDMEHGMDREVLLFRNPQWFYPNDVHANRYAHHKLYRFLTKGL
jgi:hypothetical protein